MSKHNKEEISFQREVILRKVLRIPDGRFKSGYRPPKVLAETRAYIPEHLNGIDISQSHIYKSGAGFTRTDCYATISFALIERTEG